MKKLLMLLLATVQISFAGITEMHYRKEVEKNKTVIYVKAFGLNEDGSTKEYKIAGEKELQKFAVFEASLSAPADVRNAIIQFKPDGSALKVSWTCLNLKNDCTIDAGKSGKIEGVDLRSSIETSPVRNKAIETLLETEIK